MTPEPLPENPTHGADRFWHYFIGTLICLLIASLILLGMAHWHMTSNARHQALQKAADQRAYELLDRYSQHDLASHFPNTDTLIETLVDEAFAPVYTNIRRFANRHYSVTGEYTELFYAASGDLAEVIDDSLFEGLQQRLQSAATTIGAEFIQELADNNAEFLRSAGEGYSRRQQLAYRAALALALDDMQRRFTHTGLAAKGSAAMGGVAAGTMASKAIATALAKKLFALSAAKTTGKVAIKSTGAAGGSATGAVLGSIIPGLGTAAGGIIGGIIGWFTIDKIVVETDEYLHRDAFEEELKQLIDEQKAQLKLEIRESIRQSMAAVTGKSPKQLIERD